jgi:hypothetical protein
MPAIDRRFALLAGSGLLALLSLTLLLLSTHPVVASVPLQGNGGSVDIYDKECTFWLDFDDDGEGDLEIDAGAGSYARQQTPVVGSCEFKLNTPVAATLVLETELDVWRSEVELVQEPGLPERRVLQPGKVSIPDLEGGMKITIEHRGLTPRSGKVRPLNDGYQHQVQVPRPFRLLEIKITTPADDYDRLEESSNSASRDYIAVHERISNPSPGDETAMATPDEITILAKELLDEGYPQIADRLLEVEVESGHRDGVNWWMWSTIALIVVILIVIAVFAFVAWNGSRKTVATTTSSDPWERNM